MYVFMYTEKNIEEVIKYQTDYCKKHFGNEPNVLVLGIEIVKIFEKYNWFERDKENGSIKYKNMKLYLDGEFPTTISAIYNPFVKDYFRDAEPGSINLESMFEVAEMPVEENGVETDE